MSGEADDMVNTGRATLAQLGKLFRMDKPKVARLLAGVPRAGRRGTYDVYDVREAAAVLQAPGYEIEDAIRHMNQADLPSLVGKEFWNGQRARKAYERESGNLWETDDIVAVLARTFNAIVMAQKLMLDQVERETSVTPRQREIVKRISEGTINQTKEVLFEQFVGYPAPQDNLSDVVL